MANNFLKREYRKYIKKYGDQVFYFEDDPQMLSLKEIEDHFFAMDLNNTFQALLFLYEQLKKYKESTLSRVDPNRRKTSFIYNPNTKTAILFMFANNTSKIS